MKRIEDEVRETILREMNETDAKLSRELDRIRSSRNRIADAVFTLSELREQLQAVEATPSDKLCFCPGVGVFIGNCAAPVPVVGGRQEHLTRQMREAIALSVKSVILQVLQNEISEKERWLQEVLKQEKSDASA